MTIIEEHKALRLGSLLASNHGEYKIESILGMGGFGITYKATKDVYEGNIAHKHTYAIKEFFIKDICMRDDDGNVVVNPAQQDNFNMLHKAFSGEAKLLQKLPKHDSLVSVNELFDANNTSYYVMQYLDHSLTQRVDGSNEHRLSEEEALDVFSKIAEAVAVLHDNRRLHLDIKPDNIMFSGGTPCLIDFGNSRAYNKKGKLINQNAQIVCSDGYAPQEQYVGIDTFSPSADIYALGATLLYMLSGKHPLPANEITGKYIDEILPEGIDARVRKVIHTSLATNPNSRYESIEQLLMSLNRKMSMGGSQTMLIGDKPATNKASILPVLAKIRKYVLACLIVILIVCLMVFAGNKILTSCNTSTLGNDTATVMPTDTIKEDTIKEIPVVKNDTIKKKDNKVSVTEKVQHDDQPIKGSEPTPSNSNTADLGWAIWNGKIKNGKPTGWGTLEIIKEHRLYDDVVVHKGDKIRNCEFNEYGFYQGTLIRTDGTKEELMR